MDFSDRLKTLRKELGLTQEEFANRIRVKRNTVANYETRSRIPVTAILSLICREFNVREEWLLDGIGEMFLPEPEFFSLDDFAKQNNMTDFERDLLMGYLKLDANARRLVMDMISEVSAKYQNMEKDDIDAKVAAYRAELVAQKKTEGKSEASRNTEIA